MEIKNYIQIIFTQIIIMEDEIYWNSKALRSMHGS